MEKIKLIQEVTFSSKEGVTLKDSLEIAKSLKSKLEKQVIEEGLENEIEIVVNLKDSDSSIRIIKSEE